MNIVSDLLSYYSISRLTKEKTSRKSDKKPNKGESAVTVKRRVEVSWRSDTVDYGTDWIDLQKKDKGNEKEDEEKDKDGKDKDSEKKKEGEGVEGEDFYDVRPLMMKWNTEVEITVPYRL